METPQDLNAQAPQQEPTQNTDPGLIDFDFKPATANNSIIKVVGVGGGGSNAVQHMFDSGIDDVSFLIINTDKQALRGSSIPNKLLISEKGLGAGANPVVGRDFALQYTDGIRNALSDGTEMVFITAGMGGGTGTGAAPIVAQVAHELGILTIGIVTIPFRFEGRKKIMMALEGVRAIKQWCDALLVVNNNRLIDIYPDLDFGNAFAKADDTLTTAAKSISDIITKKGYINLDFADVSTTLRNGGVALISTGVASGDNRLADAIELATNSPLLQDNNINDSRHLLFELCFSHSNPISMNEIAYMNEFVEKLNSDIEVIWGAMYDDTLGDDVRIIILASGFTMDDKGAVLASDKIKQYVKKLQDQMRMLISQKQELLAEFDECPEATDILAKAISDAKEKCNNLTADDSIDDETAKFDTAVTRAREKLQEMLDARRAAQEAAAVAEHNRQLQEQIARLQAQLLDTTAKPESPAMPKIAEEPVKPAAPAPTEAPQKPAPQAAPAAPTETAPPTAPATPASTPTATTAPVPHPASNTIDGIDNIRQFYGEEAASQLLISDARKAYYVLDDQELSNEELIRRLEQIPAYNRSLEDLGQLRAVSRQPAQPKPVGGNPDGTIHF